MIRVVYHVPGDEPHVETLPEEPSRAHMEAVAEIVGAVAYTPEWDPFFPHCGRALRHHEDVGTYCPSGCPR